MLTNLISVGGEIGPRSGFALHRPRLGSVWHAIPVSEKGLRLSHI